MPFTVDPIRMYENVNGICTVLSTGGTLAVGNNQLVVAAVTGYRLRIMGWIMQSDGATVGKIQFKSASGGTAITGPMGVPTSTSGVLDKLPVTDCGYFETNISEGLYADITTAGIYITLFYIKYIP